MSSLRELQLRFAEALFADDGAPPTWAAVPAERAAERMSVYRRALRANYRNALGASYPVVRTLVGAQFFNAAVDAFVRMHPSKSGDLNVYGDEFGDFLDDYPYAADLPYLADVARLEWAQDEANRAADGAATPADVLAALAAVPAERLPSVRLVLAPSCRLVASPYPVLRIWKAHQHAAADDDLVALDGGADAVLVRREPAGVSIERLAATEHAWLAALAGGASLGAAIEATDGCGAPLDLGAVLGRRIGDGTIAGVAAP
jgi:hypothetical protein